MELDYSQIRYSSYLTAMRSELDERTADDRLFNS